MAERTSVVRERIYLRVSAEQVRERLSRELSRPFGHLAGSWIWLQFVVAPTVEGCVVELRDPLFPRPVTVARTWALPAVAAFVVLTYAAANIFGQGGDPSILALAAFLIVAEGIIVAQPTVAAWMYGQYVRESFGSASLTKASATTGSGVTVRR